TENPLAQHLGVSDRTVRRWISGHRWPDKKHVRKKSIKKPEKLLHAKNRPLLGGGLEPHFRVLFSAIFHAFPCGISIRVETCGTGRKQKCGLLWSIYVQNFLSVLIIVCLSARM